LACQRADIKLHTMDVTPTTLRSDVERRRLEHRAHGLERVVEALRDRAVLRARAMGRAPQPLHQAIATFSDELGAVRRRLSDLPRHGSGRT
jgi:hypothetical protein